MRKMKLFLAILLSVAIASCGGGGGGGGSTSESNGSDTGGSSYAISGKVADSVGTGTSGVDVALSGTATASTSTDSSGNYSFTGLANGSYTVTPSSTGYTFTPTSKAVTISSANATGQDFVGTAGSGGVASIKVKVQSYYNGALLTATVVLGNSDGSMVSYGTTDSNGEITFNNPPANATITAITSHSDGSGTQYEIDSKYDVNVSAITFDKESRSNNSDATVATVALSNSVSGAARYEVCVSGEGCSPATLSSSNTVDIDPLWIQSDGTVSFLAVAYDASDNLIGYGTLLDQTVSSGMNVNLTINKTDISNITYTLSNVPNTAKGLNHYFSVSRKDQELFDYDNYLTQIPSSVSFSAVPGDGDRFDYDIYLELDQNNDSTNDSGLWIGKRSPTLSSQAFDFSQALAIPSNLAVSGAGTATPAFSWSGIDPSADFLAISFDEDNYPNDSYYYYIQASPARSSIVFPQLPDTLAALRPTWVSSFGVWGADLDFISGYSDLLTFLVQRYNGTSNLPTTFSVRSASAWTELTTSTVNTASARLSSPKQIRLNPYFKSRDVR